MKKSLISVCSILGIGAIAAAVAIPLTMCNGQQESVYELKSDDIVIRTTDGINELTAIKPSVTSKKISLSKKSLGFHINRILLSGPKSVYLNRFTSIELGENLGYSEVAGKSGFGISDAFANIGLKELIFNNVVKDVPNTDEQFILIVTGGPDNPPTPLKGISEKVVFNFPITFLDILDGDTGNKPFDNDQLPKQILVDSSTGTLTSWAEKLSVEEKDITPIK